MEVQFGINILYFTDDNYFESAQLCSSIFIEKPGGGEEVVYAPSGQNATFTCAVNGTDLFWEFNTPNVEIPRLANELERNGIFTAPLKSTRVGRLCSTLTILVSDYSHNADICCNGRRASNPSEDCCTRLIEYGMLIQLKCTSAVVCAMFVTLLNGTNREHAHT